MCLFVTFFGAERSLHLSAFTSEKDVFIIFVLAGARYLCEILILGDSMEGLNPMLLCVYIN
jgi:hypothetical protein